MMKNFKRLFTFLLLVVMTVSMAFSACGTPSADNGSSSISDNEITSSSDTEEGSMEETPTQQRKLCTLQEAYENGWLTEEDLKTAAEYHAAKKDCPEPIDEEIKANMRALYAQQLNADPKLIYSDYTADDILLYRFYGTYNGCSIVILYHKDSFFIDVVRPCTIQVADASFYFVYYKKSEHLFAYYEG